MNRLDTLRHSLDKKQAKFNKMLENHIEDVKSANGQPLNDKRNGRATLNRWDKQNEALLKQQSEIEITINAIEKEERLVNHILHVNNDIPQIIMDMVTDGTLEQWRKFPHIFFVSGVDKARIIWDKDKKVVAHKFYSCVLDVNKRKKFAEIYNKLNTALNKQ